MWSGVASALVDADLVAADELHPNDFQLITPRGNSFSKDEYLGAIASGNINDLLWELKKWTCAYIST